MVHNVHCNTAHHCQCSLVHNDNECKVCVCTLNWQLRGIVGDLIQLRDGPGGKSVSQSGGAMHNQPCGTCWTVEGQMGDGSEEQGHK